MIIQVSCLQRGRALCRCQPQIEYSYEMPIGRNGYSVKIQMAWPSPAIAVRCCCCIQRRSIWHGWWFARTKLPPVSSACRATSEVIYKRRFIHHHRRL
jgi:hypothetical protein